MQFEGAVLADILQGKIGRSRAALSWGGFRQGSGRHRSPQLPVLWRRTFKANPLFNRWCRGVVGLWPGAAPLDELLEVSRHKFLNRTLEVRRESMEKLGTRGSG